MMEERYVEWGEETREKARQYIAKRKRQLSRLNLAPLKPMESARPPTCTRPDRVVCRHRFYSQRFEMFVCRGNQCKPRPEDLPEPWTKKETHRLMMNSHLSLSTLCRLLGRDRDDVRAKLEEVDP